MKLEFLKSILGIIKDGLNIGDFFSTHFIHFKRKNLTHYFKTYHKHVTIYNDGSGVIINDFDIIFNKNEKTHLKRGIDISDGKVGACFPLLKEMKKQNICNRFSEYGFWVYSEDKIISSVKEDYHIDSDDDENKEDIVLKNDRKNLRWTFNFNYSRIKPDKVYKVIYVMSIPDMFPIKDGRIDITQINDLRLSNDLEIGNSSAMKITNPIEKFRYTVSFEEGIVLEREPKCSLKTLTEQEKSYHPKLVHSYNTIYNKYTCNIKKPKIGSTVRINWQFKEVEK